MGLKGMTFAGLTFAGLTFVRGATGKKRLRARWSADPCDNKDVYDMHKCNQKKHEQAPTLRQ